MPWPTQPLPSNAEPTDWADRATWTPGNPPVDAFGQPDRADERVVNSFSTKMRHRVPRTGEVVTINLPAPPPEEPQP